MHETGGDSQSVDPQGKASEETRPPSASPGTRSFHTVDQPLALRRFCFRSSGRWKRHLSPHPLRWPLCIVSLESQPCFSVWWISSSTCEPLIALQAELGASLSTWVGDCPQTQCIDVLSVVFFEASWVGLWVCLTILFLLRIPSVQCRAH